MAKISTISRAVGVITSGVIANAETITVAGKVYTFQTTLTNVDGNVNLGADDDASLDNLAAAINLGNTGESAVGAGTDYAAAMTVNPHCTAVAVSDGATVNVSAIVPGVVGGFIPMLEATTGATVDATLGAGTAGVGSVTTAVNEILDTMQLNSEVIAALDQLNSATVGA